MRAPDAFRKREAQMMESCFESNEEKNRKGAIKSSEDGLKKDET